MDSSLFQVVRTKSDYETLLSEIDILQDSLYRTGETSYDNVLISKIRSTSASLFQTTAASKDIRKQLLLNIKKNLLLSKFVRLTLAFEPSNQSLETILAWIRKNVDEMAVLDISTEQNIIGGAIIEYQGKYMDMSLRKKLENLKPKFETK